MAPPRSVADATRFTPTGPHAFTRPDKPSAETPSQRVIRLREAAKRSKAANVSTFDRVVDRGRIWADRAHRTVAIGLIGATVLCGGITIFAFTDMILYNRRRKREYLQSNPPPQLSPVETELAAQAAQAARSRSTPVSQKLKDWAVSGLTPADQEEEARESRLSSSTAEEEQRGIGEALLKRPGADDLVKSEKVSGGGGIMSSITGWWTGKP